MDEELHEADVLWPDAGQAGETGGDTAKSCRRVAVVGPGRRKPSSSRPVSIPSARANGRGSTISAGRSWASGTFDDYYGGEDDDDASGGMIAGGTVIPPHVIVARRTTTEEMALSGCAGSGRTVKGRDLKQLRNSVLKLTGFLETS